MVQDWEVISETWLFGVIENPILPRQLPTEIVPDEVSLGSQDVDISWRGDGKYFASISRADPGRRSTQFCAFARLHLFFIKIFIYRQTRGCRSPFCDFYWVKVVSLLFRAFRLAAGQPWVVRVWERESGALHAMGEHAAGLLGTLAWQPNGRHLYAPCMQSGGALRVLLFERNGLQHGGFDVPGTGALLLLTIRIRT